MWLFTQAFTTARLNAVPGMPVPHRLDTPIGRRHLRQRFGDKCIIDVDPRQPQEFFKLVGAPTNDDVQQKYFQLKALTEEQARRINTLERENTNLKRTVRRYKGQEDDNGTV